MVRRFRATPPILWVAIAVFSVGAGSTVARSATDGDLVQIRAALSSGSAATRARAALAARDESLVPDLQSALADPEPGVRVACATALSRFPSGAPALLAATADAYPEVVETALRGLEGVATASVLARVERLLRSPQPRTRASAAHALVAAGGVSSHGAEVDALLQDRDTGVRSSLLAAMREHPAGDAIPHLAPLLASPEARTRREAAAALAAIDSAEATGLLSGLLGDPEPEIRALAVSGIAGGRTPEVVARLLPLAGDPSETVRSAVAHAVGTIGRPEGLPALKILARDVDPRVRQLAASAAGRIGTAKSLSVLEDLLRDGDMDVRVQAIQACGAVKGPGALALLRKEAARSRGAVRIAAIAEIGARRDREALPMLRRCLEDADEALRAASRRAIEQIESGSEPQDR